MIDQNSQFFAILTAIGEAKHANAIAMGLDWMFTHMGIGDANGADPIPDRLQTQLINEWRRAPVNQIRVAPANPNVVITEQIIPADVGGKWIREIGLYDVDGDLVAVANCAPSFKPLLAQGTGKTQVVRMNFIVSSAANIVLKIDPSVVLATREYVDQKVREEIAKLDHKESVLYATTGAIVLSGLGVQAGGDWSAALVAGTRVLVKDQASAKDNGLYSATAGAWARTADADSNADVTSGLVVAVEQGSTLADTRWQLVTDGNVVLGTTALTFQTANNPTATTAPQFDNSKLITTTEFVRRQGVQYSGSGITSGSTYSMDASHIGGVLQIYSGTDHTITLPPLTGVPNGATVTLSGAMGAGGTATLLPPAGKALRHVSGATMGSPVTLQRDEVAKFQAYGNGGEWRLIGGSMMLRYAAASPDANFITLPQFDSSKGLVTAEFVQRALGNYGSVIAMSAAGTLIESAFGSVVSLIGTFEVTLPTASVLSGAAIHFRNVGSGIVTVTCAGADTINVGAGQATETGIALQPGATLELTTAGGSGWWAAGSAQLQYSQVFARTPDQFDVSKLPATTEFVQRRGHQFSGFTLFSGLLIGLVSHVGGFVHCVGVGPNSYSLPDTVANDIPPGATIRVNNWAVVPLELAVQGADMMQENIDGVWSATAREIPPDSYVDCTFVGSNEWLLTGTGVMGKTRPFASSIGDNGYQILPSGLILQWCEAAFIGPGAEGSASFPIVFPTDCIFAIAAARGSVGSPSSGNVVVGDSSVSGVNLHNWGVIGAPAKVFAIGC